MTKVFTTIKLDKNIPVPLYYQLKKQLFALIEDSSLKEGDVLPPENELCELLSISRPTIRQAFSELVTEGYLSRFKGKGTFVSKPKVEERFFSKLESFETEMRSKGLAPHTKVIKLTKLTGPHEANEQLKISLDAPLLYLIRLRSVNDMPVVYLETFLPYEEYKKLMDVDFNTHSLYDSLEEIYNIRVNRVRREIEAINAPRKEAELLNIPKNTALSLVKTVAYADPSPNPMEFSIARYRGDINKFSVEVYR